MTSKLFTYDFVLEEVVKKEGWENENELGNKIGKISLDNYKERDSEFISKLMTLRESWKELKGSLKPTIKKLFEEIKYKKNNDLQTFIFDENEVVKRKVFSSHLLEDDSFGFGILLPREEDIKDKKGNVIGTQQVWRPVIITSNKRGLVVSKWLQETYKINFGEVPYEMRLRWELKDINNFLREKDVEKIDGKKLFNDIKRQYEKYLYFRSKEWYSINPLWDIGTYSHQMFSAFPLKENRGMSGTAKTKTMVVSSYISLNSTDIMTNPSESTLFRETEIIRPTKYIDEAEKLFKFTKEGMESDNRVELINASYTRNGCVPRQEKIGGKYFTKWYHVYSPTQISSINGLYGATETRAITQIHTKAPDRDGRGEVDPEEDVNDPTWKDIKNKCYRWTLENWKEIYKEYLNFNILTKLKKRDLQIWKPLLVLAKIIDEKDLLPEVLTFAERLSTQRKNDVLSESSLDYKYLTCLNVILLKNTEKNKVYVDEVRKTYNSLFSATDENKSNKSISSHLDNLGFKELRGKDRIGAYYELSKNDFDDIITPITDDFKIDKKPSHSSHSSQNKENSNKISDEYNKNNDECDEYNNDICDECDENDECDDNSKKRVFCDSCSKPTTHTINNIRLCEECSKNVSEDFK